MERVADVLGRVYPQFNTVAPNCKVADALYQMICENSDYLIVLEQDKFVGVISDHDIASKVLFDNRPLNRIEVGEFLNRTLPVVTPEDTVEYGSQLLERYNARHLAVYDQFTFKGVLSSQDLMQALMRQQAQGEDVRGESNFLWVY